MYLIVGLGNPEKKYDNTRHNAGFAALDKLADKLGIRLKERRFDGLCGSGTFHLEKVMLIKPQTYMNLSGRCVRQAADYYRIPDCHVIVIYDDISFPCGRLRVRGQGSAGGHNGIKSLIAELGSDGFPRVRIGVGGLQPEEDIVAHVLGHFSKEDMAVMEHSYEAAADAALSLIENGVDETMNRFNGADFSEPD